MDGENGNCTEHGRIMSYGDWNELVQMVFIGIFGLVMELVHMASVVYL